jgi:hypothetical protein
MYCGRIGNTTFCDACFYEKRQLNQKLMNSYQAPTTDSSTAGYAGYNEGLGVEIKNKGDWKETQKRMGVRSVG